MGIEKIVVKQYQDKVDRAARLLGNFAVPAEGWIRTVRKALGMSGSQLAERVGVTKARISKAEQAELTGGVTIRSMQTMAEAMNCRFVYAVIPEREIGAMVRARALHKAREQVKAASTQMALEDQALSEQQLADEVERLADEILKKMPSDLWSD